jgi:two-component system sensor histidine kinase DegS
VSLKTLFGRQTTSPTIALIGTAELQEDSAQTIAPLTHLRALDEQRKRIAMDLHDGPVQTLTSVLLRVELATASLRKQPDSAPEELAQVRTMARECLAELRGFISDLGPAAPLEEFELPTGARQCVSSLRSRWGITATLTLGEGLDEVGPEAGFNACRVLQEALTNVGKHADASVVTVSLGVVAGVLVLEVADDGRGFDLLVARKRSSERRRLGLVGMAERARALSGDLRIDSVPGRGTRVRLRIPLRDGSDVATV